MPTTRLVLLANFSSMDVEDSAVALMARGYDPVTYFELHKPTYQYNVGKPASTAIAHRWMFLELTEGALLVIHPDLDPALLQEMVAMCRTLGLPVARMADLKYTGPMSQEEVDAVNMIDAPRTQLLHDGRVERKGLYVVRPEQPAPVQYRTPHPADVAEKIEVLLKNEQLMAVPDGYVPGTTLNMAAPTGAATTSTRRLRERLRMLPSRLLHWERRLNTLLGHCLKNPMTRRAPIPYRLRTGPLSTTG